VWVNPPYSFIYPWVKKAHEESLRGATVVMLLPSWLANWFHDFVLPYAHIDYVKGRLKFTGADGQKFTAYFDSVVVIFPKERAIVTQ
jgi:DNA N-6-adenine-methyltransferase (Dam)